MPTSTSSVRLTTTARRAWKDYDRANGFLRRRLAKSVRMRQVPHLHFHLDTTLDRAAHLDALIAEALPKSESMAKTDADSGDAPVNDGPKL